MYESGGVELLSRAFRKMKNCISSYFAFYGKSHLKNISVFSMDFPVQAYSCKVERGNGNS